MIVDPQNPVALVRVGDGSLLLQQGEWSEWLPVQFDLMPHVSSVSGMARFYLKQVRPHLLLYMTPVNIDPRDPAQAIAAPAKYAYELAEDAGPFYTEEMPEDTKALRAGVLTPHEFLTQTQLVLDERKRLLDAELRRFANEPERSLMFFYFSSIDQRHHMLYREADPTDPLRPADTAADLANSMRDTYRQIDEQVGKVMSAVGENTAIVVMSDHGFSSVPPAGALESLAGAARLPAPDRQLQSRQVRVAAGHRLVRDARVRDRPELAVSQRSRPREARHRLAEAARRAGAEARAGARRLGRRRDRPEGHHAGARCASRSITARSSTQHRTSSSAMHRAIARRGIRRPAKCR